MSQPTIHSTIQSSTAKRSWVQAAVATAMVAGAFSLVVAALMVVDSLKSRAEDLRAADRLAVLKAALRDKPMDEALMGRIRALDVELRRNFARGSQATDAGRWLLLAGVAVCLIALKSASVLRKKLPMPKAAMPDPAAWGRLRRVARRAIALAGVVLALIGGCLVFTASSIFGRREPTKQAAAYPSDEEVAQNWPRFRGPGGLGISAYSNVPTSWDGKTGAGILWKAELPLGAPSSPIVWGGKVFLTGSSKTLLEVYCYDAATGQFLWKHAATGIPGSPAERPKSMEGVEWAPSTPATDGSRVYAIFSTGDLVALDFTGKRLWARNLGTPENSYGHASSLALWRNLLIIQYDQATADDKKSKLMALDVATGRLAWETRRDTPQTWATPIVVGSHLHFAHGGYVPNEDVTPKGEQIIACGDPFLCGYDPASGKELWRAECLGGEIAPSPTYANGVAYTANAGSYATAVRTDGQGDVTKTHVLWKGEDGLPDICSPLANGEFVWTLTSGGTLTCYDAKTGKRVWEKDFELNCSSSPSLVGDKVYVMTEKGVTLIVAASREFRELGKAELGEGCRTSPAFLAAGWSDIAAFGIGSFLRRTLADFSDGRIIIRGEKHLFCIGRK